MRWRWVNFQCRGVLLIWIIVGQEPIALAVGAGWGCLDIFSLIYHFSFLSPSLWETARYRLKYRLKGPLSPKQPTNQKGPLWPKLPFSLVYNPHYNLISTFILPVSGDPVATKTPIFPVGWLVVLSLTALWDGLSVYIGPLSPKQPTNQKGPLWPKLPFSLVYNPHYNLISTFILPVSGDPVATKTPIFPVGWLVVLRLTALWDSISVYIGPSPRREMINERTHVQTTPPHLLQAQ